jgi:hypothetical protein
VPRVLSDFCNKIGTRQTIGAGPGVRQLPKVNRTFRRPYTSWIDSTAARCGRRL